MSQLVRQGTSGECDFRSANCGLKDILDKDDIILFVSPLNPPQPLFLIHILDFILAGG